MVREFLALPLNTAKASVRHFGWSLPQQQVPVPGRDGSIRCSLLLAVLQLNSQRHCKKGAVCRRDNSWGTQKKKYLQLLQWPSGQVSVVCVRDLVIAS